MLDLEIITPADCNSDSCPLIMADDDQSPKVWEVYKGGSSIWYQGRCITGKDRHMVRGVSFLLLVIPAFFYGFSGPYLWDEVSPATVLFVAYFQFLSFCNYLMTSYTDPGILPRALKEEGEKMYPLPPREDNSYLPPPRVRDVEVNGQDITIRYCFTCHHYKAPRVNHCGRTNDCVEKFDHYCPWTGQVIGARNYRFFIAFLLTTVVLDILVLALSIVHLEALIRSRGGFGDAIKAKPHLAVIIPLTFCLLFSVGGLLGFHEYLILSAKTTNETFKLAHGERSPYHLGSAWKNHFVPLLGPRLPTLMRWRTPASAYDLRIGPSASYSPANPSASPTGGNVPTAVTTHTTHSTTPNAYTTYTRTEAALPDDAEITPPLLEESPHQPTALAQALAGQPPPLQHAALARLQTNPSISQPGRDVDDYGLPPAGRKSSLSLQPMTGDVCLNRSADQLDKVSRDVNSLPGSRALSQTTSRVAALSVPLADMADRSDSSMRVNGNHTPLLRDSDDENDSDDNNELNQFVCYRQYNPSTNKLTVYQKPSKTALKRQAILDAAADNDDSEDNDIALDNSDDDFVYTSDGEQAKPASQRKRNSRGKAEETPSRKARKPPAKRSKRSRAGGKTKLQFRLPATDEAAQPAHATASVMRALALANVPPNAEALPSREVEFYEISSFVTEKLEARTSGCMFVSGVPGTGKTATIRAVARDLQAQLDRQELPFFQFVEINAMSLTAPQQAYSELWSKISENKDKSVPATQACQLLRKRFTTPAPRRHSCVVLLDEVDYLHTRKQDVLYSLFDWPTHKHSQLILVAVANTMDLPERVMAHRVSSRLGLTRSTFSPYTREQLVEILKSRVEGVDAFDDSALELCSRKVSAVSGDARRALGICRRAAEMMREKGQTKVDILTVSAALTELSSSSTLSAIRHAALHERVCLLALLCCFRQRGVEEAQFRDLQAEHLKLCQKFAVVVPSPSTISKVVSSLGSCRVLLLEHGRMDMHRRVRLNCSQDDVFFALRDDNMATSIAQAFGASQQ
eukprot:m.103652 g.103652  ORF g.103652 m.103652 type:complete len:1030 (-) comp15228_c0_seq3:78-3167(-)